MKSALHVRQAGAGATIQDQGRPGFLAVGLSRGGAADALALAEGAALLGQNSDLAALELAFGNGRFEAEGALRIALTGALCPASIDGTEIAWNASHQLRDGQCLTIGAAKQGRYAYLHLGGGIASALLLGARSAHLAAGLGAPITAGAVLPVGFDKENAVGMRLKPEERFGDAVLRIVPSIQTEFFAPKTRARFARTLFTCSARANRMGLRLEGAPFTIRNQRSRTSEAIVAGDVQLGGDGAPFVLLCEHQTTGGYPRIGTVIAPDLPAAAQTTPGGAVRFQWVGRKEAHTIMAEAARQREALPSQLRPLRRDPHDIPNLSAYQLIGGVTAGREDV